MTTITFHREEQFEAKHAAETWLASNGYSVGPTQIGGMRGVLKGDFAIAKWRNLCAEEKEQLDGTMTGDMRHGPVTITLKGTP
jgi:hypothetical protein